ncbi:MAG: type I-E CRISPR-associated protein Cse2/CasB [Candidatus Methylumidiphilus sp.]
MNHKSKKNYLFDLYKPDHVSFKILRHWWQELHDKTIDSPLDEAQSVAKNSKPKQNFRGERAALRRAESLTAVMFNPGFHRLRQALRNQGLIVSEYQLPNLAAIAGLAAMIEDEATDSLATSMGKPKEIDGKKSCVSELRMRRILACDDLEELYTFLRRGLALLDNKANLANLASIIWNWKKMDEKHPYDPRRRMACDYYEVAPLN